MKYLLETIAFDMESCFAAERGGSDRIELCSGPAEGGTTPSQGFIRAARNAVSIDLFPIIRPRGGDFCYTDEECSIIEADIRFCKAAGCDGVVFGILNSDATVDKKRCGRLVALAYPMSVTFHRAFDRVVDPGQALEDVIDIGCERILTAGFHPTAEEGKENLKNLIEAANNRIIIMPGSGVRSGNLESLAAFTGANEFHSSARKQNVSGMTAVNPFMREVMQHATADEQEIRSLAAVIAKLNG